MNGVKVWNAAKVMLKTLAVALIILAIVLITGHGDVFKSSAATPRAGEPLACTEIGCTSGLFAGLGAVRQAFPNATSVKLCLGTRCRVIPRRNLGSVQIGAHDLATGEQPLVRLVVRNRKGKAIGRSSVRPVVQEVQPNGEDCPPVCHQVHVGMGSGGRLRAA